MSHAAAVLSEYRTIPLSLLDESTTNPRRTFEPNKLMELAQSISVSGLIQPITVRPKEDRFEIIAGARRYRAAQIAELAEVPTRILQLNDAQMLEVQIVENSQREDVHPYEEASGYQRLLDLPGYDVAALSSKCSKSQSHIYARLTLLSLIPEVAEAFQKDALTASHANLLARLTAEQQALAFPNAYRKDYGDDEQHLLPAKHLAEWIQDNLYLALLEAPFDRESSSLLPQAGSCVMCPKRTGFNTALFADVTDDNCLDGDCFRSKINAHIESAKSGIADLIQISTVWRPVKDKPTAELLPSEYRKIGGIGQDSTTVLMCDSAAPAIVTHGHGVGTIHVVCADPDCQIHYPRQSSGTASGDTDNNFDREMEERQQELNRRKAEREKRVKRLGNLISRTPSTGSEEQMRFVLKALVTGDLDYAMEHIALRFEGDDQDSKASDEVCVDALFTCEPSSLFRFLTELALGSYVDIPRPEEHDYLLEAEKVFPKPPKTSLAPAAKKSVRTAVKTKGR